MSKKRKKRGSGKPQNRPQRETRKQRKNLYFWAGAIIVVAIAVLILSGRMPFGGKEGKKGKSFTVQGGEKRPVLDPMMFSGRTRLAYAAAEKYPEVMDEVFCYCTCDEPPFYHKSLLSCFVEKHGAG